MKMLKDLLKALTSKNGGKKMLALLNQIGKANPELAGLVDALKKLLKDLRSGKPVNMKDFANKIKDLFNRLKQKGTISNL